MTTMPPSRNPFHRIPTLLATTATLALASLSTATPAAAWGSESVIGQAGTVTPPQVTVSDIGFHPQPPTLTFNSSAGPLVKRSPAATGAQNVFAHYIVERWTGARWDAITMQQHVRRIDADQSETRFPALFIQPVAGTGNYRVVLTFHWFEAGQNASIGATKLVPDAVSDQMCVTPRRPCTSYAGYVTIGPIK
ncbi:hypothetical protein [Streptomyces erythrochromogenes]|uniref:hypothetical protein n=1 Tax=Streptomyces erythrochromogenes TaxID=285574 RepID=UPI0036ABD85C